MPASAVSTLSDDRDLRLSNWGPYSKRYAGISHIAEAQRGARLDVTIVPGFFRGDLVVPDGLRPSRFHPWEAAPGLTHYTYRYELEWKDRVYCDVSFTSQGDHAHLISCEWVNASEVDHQVVSHAVIGQDYARATPHGDWLRTASVHAIKHAQWVDGCAHGTVQQSAVRPDDGLIADGLLRGEVRTHDAVGGSALTALGRGTGDAVTFLVDLTAPINDGLLRLRHRLPDGDSGTLTIDENRRHQVQLNGDGAMSSVDVGLGPRDAGQLRLTMSAPEGTLQGLEIDGFLIGEREDVARSGFTADPLNTDVKMTEMPGGALLEPRTLPSAYGVAWEAEDFSIREFLGSDLDMLLRSAKLDARGIPGPSRVSSGADKGTERFIDIVGPALLLPAHSRRTLHGLVCDGAPEKVAEQIDTFRRTAPREHRAVLDRGHREAFDPEPSSTPTTPSIRLAAQRRFAATLLTNVVYPTYVRQQYVRHFAPGRWWDSLYSWDSGMIGLGLAQVDPDRAADCLETYLANPDDPHSAYIHHGTTLPTQQYLAAELLAHEGGRERFARWYPSLREQYQFLSGRHPSSRTRMPSGLLNPFRYFYNSGGWDDYPAQVETHRRRISGSVAPMVTTSHAIRSAKLLLLAAADPGQVLETEENTAEYIRHIGDMTYAIQHCWDPEAGYFGYAMHDDTGTVTGLLRDEDGVNLNQGIDGISPLIAGACTPEQAATLLNRVLSQHRLWTDVGISTVDRSAPYYSAEGYWNGQVWVAHQWFLFRAMLDLGRPEDAYRIATAVLDAWTLESERTYDSWEHISIITGRGGGWHQFGGLSAPLLSLFAALHRRGTLTTGFDTRVLGCEFDNGGTCLTARLIGFSSLTGTAAAIAVMEPGHRYEALIDGEPIHLKQTEAGPVQLTWTSDQGSRSPLSIGLRTLEVRPIHR
ncbi:MAG: hypothetical protein L0G94_08840 [Brachybacterium sp.]|uniref:MGH1-like glycoside hydrolase domain-containing protein n=1 Tax=Brachybacterium sp. TaxID=1891286 RepID=UPI002647A9E4|nr:hypothetical protein [Brachybacterium sp.]MDN5686772.1 hypothetical protein [Brachybacterium sp.]